MSPPDSRPPAELTRRRWLIPNGTVTLPGTGPEGQDEQWTYQLTDPRFANAASPAHPRLQVKRWVPPSNPQTPAQQAWRAIFAAAIAAWQALDAHDRQLWHERGVKLALPAYNVFIRHYLRAAAAAPPAPPARRYDGGAHYAGEIVHGAHAIFRARYSGSRTHDGTIAHDSTE